MIDLVKGLEVETGYKAIMQVSEGEAAMQETRVRRTKTVCNLLQASGAASMSGLKTVTS